MLTQNFWVLICFFLCIDSVFLFIQMDKYRMCISLILFGFAILMLLSEVQGRYKCVMYPIISMLAADRIIRLIVLLKQLAGKYKFKLTQVKSSF